MNDSTIRLFLLLKIPQLLDQARTLTRLPSPLCRKLSRETKISLNFRFVHLLHVSRQSDTDLPNPPYQAIRDWLHSIPSSLSPVEVRRGYLPYTKNKLKQLKRTGAKGAKGVVEELDPDAVLRAGGSAEGARYEADDAVSSLTGLFPSFCDSLILHSKTTDL